MIGVTMRWATTGMTKVTMRWATTGLSTDAADVDNAITWCRDRLGLDRIYGGTKWTYVGHAVFAFTDEEDAAFFMLRWL
jgi:hypothetical protein